MASLDEMVIITIRVADQHCRAIAKESIVYVFTFFVFTLPISVRVKVKMC